jgi:hypothetical protein
MPFSVLPRSFELDFDAAADSGIPGTALPGSVDPNIVVAETRFVTTSRVDVAGFGFSRALGCKPFSTS